MNKSKQISENTLFVLGAGVDVALGFPTMDNLLSELARFSVEEGKEINKAIRKHVKGMQFNLSKRAGEQGEQFGEMLISKNAHLIPTIKSALEKHSKPQSPKVKAIKSIVEQLDHVRKANFLDNDTCQALAGLAGEQQGEGDGEFLFNPRGLTLTNAPRQALRKVFQGALSEIKDLTSDEKEAFQTVVSVVSNFEEMLGEFFSGFFTNHIPNQKKYYYLAWLFWSYLHLKQIKSMHKRAQSFYQTLYDLDNHNIITFNYTQFYMTEDSSSIFHFHGDCQGYIRFDNRDYFKEDDRITGAKTPEDLVSFFEEIGNDIDWQAKRPRILLPAIVPPLAVKPIICNEYLDLWASAANKLQDADKIIIVGYSFNVADEHFNDLLRKRNISAPITLISPNIETVKPFISQVLDLDQTKFTPNKLSGIHREKNGRLTLLESKAEEISASILNQVVN